MVGRRISLSAAAERTRLRLGLHVDDLGSARVSGTLDTTNDEFLRVWGVLPDRRPIWMDCAYDDPFHIISFRPYED